MSGCLACHGPSTGPFAGPPPGNTITIVGWPGSNHIPIGALDCNGSGCHTTSNVAPGGGGFKLGAASVSAPTLTVAGHTTVAVVGACSTCHESAPYLGMLVSTAATWGDSRPTAYDSKHPTSGDCSTCHTTTPTFATNQSGSSAKPSNHIPTTAACAQCHTTAGNFAAYSVTGTHQGVTGCLTCHGPTVTTTFYNVTIVTTPSNHIPIGGLDCNGSGCHTTTNVNPGGFKLGTANVTTPTLTVAGHTTVAVVVSACSTCHETAPYLGMAAAPRARGATRARPHTTRPIRPRATAAAATRRRRPSPPIRWAAAPSRPNHIPTTAPCAQCHTTAGNYALYVMGATGHAGITSNCAQCHAYGLSFYNMAPPTLKQPPSGATGHIPSNPPNGTATLACELCHSAAVFTTFSGTVMKHAYVTSMKCDSCHEFGMTWKTNGRLWVRPSANHHAGQDCGGSGCHSSRDKLALRPRAPCRRPCQPPPTRRGRHRPHRRRSSLARRDGCPCGRRRRSCCEHCHSRCWHRRACRGH